MEILAVVAIGDATKLVTAVQEKYPQEHTQVTHNVYLVAGGGIAKDVSDRLGISEGISGTGLVFAMAGYFGYASNAIWEWVKLKRMQAV